MNSTRSASGSPGNVDEYLGEPAVFEVADTGGVAVTTMSEVDQEVIPPLR